MTTTRLSVRLIKVTMVHGSAFFFSTLASFSVAETAPLAAANSYQDCVDRHRKEGNPYPERGCLPRQEPRPVGVDNPTPGAGRPASSGDGVPVVPSDRQTPIRREMRQQGIQR